MSRSAVAQASVPPPIHASWVRLPGRWAEQVRLTFDAAGRIERIDESVAPIAGDETVGALLPALPNLHCHAFQRALAGRNQLAGAAADDFWAWRESMYRFVADLSPDDVEAIATRVYGEMRERGYGSVCEFHYLHRDPHGHAYSDPAEIGYRLIAAARSAGIALTLLPVVYQWGGFGRQARSQQQRRFSADVDWILEVVARLKRFEGPDLVVGAAAHSLRAVEAGDIRRLVDAFPGVGPFHIHAAEQIVEVEQCVASTGRRPVRLLLDAIGMDARWCVVHATHCDAGEIRDLAASGATVALCPTTEADLGDGVFPLGDYVAAGGRWGIGSDSNVCRDPFDELRLLEYGQRLLHRRRDFAGGARSGEIGDWLWEQALAGAGRASGFADGGISIGQRPALYRVPESALPCDGVSAALLSQLVFAGR